MGKFQSDKLVSPSPKGFPHAGWKRNLRFRRKPSTDMAKDYPHPDIWSAGSFFAIFLSLKNTTVRPILLCPSHGIILYVTCHNLALAFYKDLSMIDKNACPGGSQSPHRLINICVRYTYRILSWLDLRSRWIYVSRRCKRDYRDGLHDES